MKLWWKMSLKQKTMVVMITIVSLISIISILLFSKATYDIIRSEYGTYCSDLANSVAHSVDVSDVKAVKHEVMEIYRSLDPSEIIDSDNEDDPGYEDYLKRYSHVEHMEEFKNLRNSIRKMQDVSHVECIYLIWPDIETGEIVYLVDGAYTDVWAPGTLEVLYDTDFKVKGDIESGFGTLTSDTEEYGRLVTSAMPIRDSYGQVVAYAGLDYSMNEIIAQQRKFLTIVILILAFMAAAAAYAAIKLVGRFIVDPINRLSEASLEYYSDESEGEDVLHKFSELDIHTGDEIETLAESIAKMEHDINDHISALMSARSELDSTKEYAEEMEKNAYVDSLTGVRNKRSYEAAIANLRSDIVQGVARFGIAIIDINDLKMINDRYGHDHGDDAIRRICSIICEVFAHSPVFRFGGDEFVVLLRNRDLDNVEELILVFRKDLEELQSDDSLEPWERAGAAIGCSVFDQDIDSDTSDVFERADKAMYDDKRNTKAAAKKD